MVGQVYVGEGLVKNFILFVTFGMTLGSFITNVAQADDLARLKKRVALIESQGRGGSAFVYGGGLAIGGAAGDSR